jgi:branched-chain amino acid transport system substrate-binding protein
MRMPSIVKLAVTVSIAFLAAVSGSRADDKTIKIGGLLPISGPGAYFGAQDKQGIELALEEINKAGVNGYKLAVQYEDSACAPLPDRPVQT